MGAGSQSMAPPSKHPEGEVLRFDSDGDPMHVEHDVFGHYTKLIMAATAIAMAWPEKGIRHQAVLDLTGWLMTRAKRSARDVRLVINTAAKVAGVDDHEDDVASTTAKTESGQPVTANLDAFGDAAPALIKLFRVSRNDAPTRNLQLVPASSIKPENINWLYEGWTPLGCIGLQAGAEGIGKSLEMANTTTTP